MNIISPFLYLIDVQLVYHQFLLSSQSDQDGAIKAMLIGFATSLKQRSLKTRRRRMNIFCILVHVPDRNTKNR